MNAEERHLAEIERVEIALRKTKSEKLTRDYTKYLLRLKRELNEYKELLEKTKNHTTN